MYLTQALSPIMVQIKAKILTVVVLMLVDSFETIFYSIHIQMAHIDYLQQGKSQTKYFHPFFDWSVSWWGLGGGCSLMWGLSPIIHLPSAEMIILWWYDDHWEILWWSPWDILMITMGWYGSGCILWVTFSPSPTTHPNGWSSYNDIMIIVRYHDDHNE